MIATAGTLALCALGLVAATMISRISIAGLLSLFSLNLS
jgi:hypothetical protein